MGSPLPGKVETHPRGRILLRDAGPGVRGVRLDQSRRTHHRPPRPHYRVVAAGRPYSSGPRRLLRLLFRFRWQSRRPAVDAFSAHRFHAHGASLVPRSRWSADELAVPFGSISKIELYQIRHFRDLHVCHSGGLVTIRSYLLPSRAAFDEIHQFLRERVANARKGDEAGESKGESQRGRESKARIKGIKGES